MYTNIGLPRAGEISSTAAFINNGELGHNGRVIFRIDFFVSCYILKTVCWGKAILDSARKAANLKVQK